MKSYSFKKNLVPTLLMLLSFSLLSSSCKKEETTYERFEASHLRVVNALAGRTGVKFYLDTFNLTYTGTVNYATTTQYFVVQSGARRTAFFSTVSLDTFARSSVSLQAKKSYTLFLAGTVQNPKHLFTEDDLSQPAADKAKIRLAHLGQTGGAVDMTLQLEDLVTAPQPKPETTVVTNITSESISNYTQITVPTSKGNAIAQRHTIRVYEAGTKNLLTQLTGVDLRGTTTNTIIINGIKGGSPALTTRTSIEWLDW